MSLGILSNFVKSCSITRNLVNITKWKIPVCLLKIRLLVADPIIYVWYMDTELRVSLGPLISESVISAWDRLPCMTAKAM